MPTLCIVLLTAMQALLAYNSAIRDHHMVAVRTVFASLFNWTNSREWTCDTPFRKTPHKRTTPVSRTPLVTCRPYITSFGKKHESAGSVSRSLIPVDSCCETRIPRYRHACTPHSQPSIAFQGPNNSRSVYARARNRSSDTSPPRTAAYRGGLSRTFPGGLPPAHVTRRCSIFGSRPEPSYTPSTTRSIVD